jgi:hypothetical protein
VTVEDIGQLYIDFEGTTIDSSGKTTPIHHKSIEVLRRQTDGGWRQGNYASENPLASSYPLLTPGVAVAIFETIKNRKIMLMIHDADFFICAPSVSGNFHDAANSAACRRHLSSFDSANSGGLQIALLK